MEFFFGNLLVDNSRDVLYIFMKLVYTVMLIYTFIIVHDKNCVQKVQLQPPLHFYPGFAPGLELSYGKKNTILESSVCPCHAVLVIVFATTTRSKNRLTEAANDNKKETERRRVCLVAIRDKKEQMGMPCCDTRQKGTAASSSSMGGNSLE